MIFFVETSPTSESATSKDCALSDVCDIYVWCMRGLWMRILCLFLIFCSSTSFQCYSNETTCQVNNPCNGLPVVKFVSAH